eukprot:420383-Alexandrium_andersonii.AAC.1
MLWRLSPSLAALATPASSASPELSVTAFWVLTQCLITWTPRKEQPPDVLWRVAGQQAQSAPARTSRGAAACHS